PRGSPAGDAVRAVEPAVALQPPAASRLAYPATRRTDAADTLHGIRVPDPYRWLEDERSPEVQAWMESQDEFARAQLRGLAGRDAIARRLSELFYVDALGAPRHRGSRYFYSRRHATKEKAIIYVKQGRRGAERVLLDPNSWTADGSDALGGWWPSWDGKTVAYTVHQNNSDEAVLYLLDVKTGKRSTTDVIEGAKYAAASWTPGSDGFYYTWLPVDPNIPVAERPGWQTIKFHRMGDDPRKDRVVVEKLGDPTSFQRAELSKDGHWLVRIVDHGWARNDVYFRSARTPDAPWRPLAVGNDALYDVSVFRDRFYVTTNEGAPHSRIFAVDPAHPERARWSEIVRERPDATLDSTVLVGGKLSLVYLKDAVTHLEVHALDGKLVRELPLPDVGTAHNLVGREDEDEAYFEFNSYTHPPEIFRTSVARGGADLYSRVKLPVDPSLYETEQIFATSKDGTRVPVFVVHRKGAPRDGAAPALLYGYGGFNIAITPAFKGSIYPWLERGGVYAEAVLRGGSEYGEDWHRAGMLQNKQHVFDDFISAAEALVKQGFTTPSRLAIRGGSNGGLLVAAAETQRPDLFAAVLCHVPLIDMLRYQLFGSGKTWIPEYGSADDPEQFKFLAAYSPQQQVRDGVRYPPTLVLSADADDRVDPMHARKFAAALQHASTGGPVLLRIEKHSGHGGADLIRAAIEKTADELAFALAQIGASEARPTASR
ncbi:MAG TPA: prolyl oligopeptidase family serine peptidase, partial [Myxococcales bacterium]|nr:prolyl oligopeptidase family serine peptidase [Myxococcales bacterium]